MEKHYVCRDCFIACYAIIDNMIIPEHCPITGEPCAWVIYQEPEPVD